MKKIFINSINRLLIFDDSIKSIVIENPVYYRNLIFKIDEELIFSENNVELDFKKNILCITNLADININDVKLIKLLYKKLINDNKEEIAKIEEVSRLIKGIINDFSFDLDVPLSFSELPDMSKLLAAYEVEFQDPTYESFLEMFIKYIKIQCMFNNLKIIVSFGILNLFCKEEILLLKKELNLLEVCLLDFNLQSNNAEISFIVDEDWCII